MSVMTCSWIIVTGFQDLDSVLAHDRLRNRAPWRSKCINNTLTALGGTVAQCIMPLCMHLIWYPMTVI